MYKDTGYESFFEGNTGSKIAKELFISKLVLGFVCGLADASVSAHSDGLDPPDCSATLADGTRIGVEVTELVDGDLRAAYAKRRKAELDAEMSPQDSFRESLRRDKAAFPVSNWDNRTVAETLVSILSAKDQKLASTKDGPYDRMILAIFTDETMITPDVLCDAIARFSYRPMNIQEACVIMSYCPRLQRYPIFRLL